MALVYWEDEVAAPSVPFDVTFLVEEEGREAGEVAAHRLVLGLSSPVLRAQLCSAAWPDGAPGRRVRVADVTWRALRATVDYLYGKPLQQGALGSLGLATAAFLLEVGLVERVLCPRSKRRPLMVVFLFKYLSTCHIFFSSNTQQKSHSFWKSLGGNPRFNSFEM